MKHSIFFLLCIGILLMALKCEDDPDSRNHYIFDMPFKVYPAQKEYQVNDTFSLSVFLGERLRDTITDQEINIFCEDLNISFTVGVRHIDNTLSGNENLFSFSHPNLELENIEMESNGQFLKFTATIPNHIFPKGKIQLLKIIPKREGVYMIQPSKMRHLLINNQVPCDSIPALYDVASFHEWFNMDTNNPELLEEAPLPPDVTSDIIPILTERNGIYWFKVIE